MIVTVIAGKGSPGATTTALGMTLSWPTPVLLVEADPAGGSIRFGYGRGIDTEGRGIPEVRVAARRMPIADAIWTSVIQLGGNRWLLPGSTGPSQARGVDYAGLVEGLAVLDVDVIIDAGRIPAPANVTPLLSASDRVLVVLRATLQGVHTGQTAAAAATAVEPATVGSVIVGPGRPTRNPT